MHVIVCGGRSTTLTPDDCRWLTALRLTHGITTVYHGDAPGVDTAAKHWAMSEGLHVQAFPAHWQAEGLSAGPRRNARMLSALTTGAAGGPRGNPPPVPCAVIVFSGGPGTADMVAKARAAGVSVFTQQSYGEEEPEA